MILCTEGAIIMDRMLKGWRMDISERKPEDKSSLFLWNTAKLYKVCIL